MHIGAPGLVVVVVQGPRGAPGPFPFPAYMAGVFLSHACPEALCSGRGAGGGGSRCRHERLGLDRDSGQSTSTGLVAHSWFPAQLGRFPGGLHGILHHEV